MDGYIQTFLLWPKKLLHLCNGRLQSGFRLKSWVVKSPFFIMGPARGEYILFYCIIGVFDIIFIIYFAYIYMDVCVYLYINK